MHPVLIRDWINSNTVPAKEENPSGDVPIKNPQILPVVGWDVCSDPDNKHKTIGYQAFEREYGVTIEYTPLKNLSQKHNS